jgi:hypothetical protein
MLLFRSAIQVSSSARNPIDAMLLLEDPEEY